ESVIDYVLVDEEAREQIECMEVGDVIESDHHPLIVAWRGGKEKERNKGKEGRVWDEERRVVFRERLGEVEWREGGRDRGGGKELSREEIRKVTRNLKDGKAMGVDRIPNEVWKYGGEEMEEWVWRGCNEVWKGGGMARGMERGSGGADKEKRAGERGEGL
ncbi:hypothetical protein ALC57_08785, partial [Trachymyrmex cornetzi]